MDRAPFDMAIAGAGIVGAATAFFAAAAGRRVLLLEAESAPGTHATGRSAALFTEAYGPPQVRALTRASRAFYDAPPAGFASVPLLAPRGTLFVGAEDRRAALRTLHAQLLADGSAAQWLEGEAARALVPVLRPEAAACAVLDPAAFDIDVDALLQGFLRGAKRHGAVLVTGARLVAARREGGGWQLTDEAGRHHAAAVFVNAAGAWADAVAALAGARPCGVQPKRRSAFVFAPSDGMPVAAWPAVIDADERWYLKPDAGALLGSPANADPVPAHDVQPEEIDIATGIFHIEQATTLSIRRPKRSWAGLRSFVADGEPVCGFDPQVPGFFWAAALGGYGIQSAPGFGRLCAALLCAAAVPAELSAQGLDVAALAPGRPALVPARGSGPA
jgi:D-arginine dehydrogenase